MRIWVLSDLHTEVAYWMPPVIPAADVCVLAGDIARGAQEMVEWAAEHVRPHMPVVAVLGNHEFYGHWHSRERSAAQHHGWRHDVNVLDEMTWTEAGVRFVGATLWTDFEFGGGGDQGRQRRMSVAQASMRDYSRIGGDGERFTPAFTRRLHRASVEYIESVLATPFDGSTVVVTHHAPSPGSIGEGFEDDPSNGAFISDLESLISRYQPELWVHGHVHSSHDYAVGATRVTSNPKGYYGENPAFDPALVVEVPDPKFRPPGL